MLRTGFLAIAAMVGLVLTGCGNGVSLGKVTGKVTIDGEPAPNVLVSFRPKEGGPSSVGVTDASGNYELACLGRPGAPLGINIVTLTSIPAANEAPAEDLSQMSSDDPNYAKQAAGGTKSDYDSAAVREKIPPQYNSATTLEREVTSSGETYDFPIKTK